MSLLQQPVGADDQVHAAGREALERVRWSPPPTKRDSIRTVTGYAAKRAVNVWRCCAASTVVGTSTATWRPSWMALNAARMATSVLP